VYEMFIELKKTFADSFSLRLWYNEDDRRRAVDLVNKISLSIITSKSLGENERKNRDIIFKVRSSSVTLKLFMIY
ncbi:unnamed protein product, partial [Schistosoma turkestanicum]